MLTNKHRTSSVDKLTVPGELGKYEKPEGLRGGGSTFDTSEIPKDTQLETLANLEEAYKTQSQASLKAAIKYSGEISIVSFNASSIDSLHFNIN